jgi:hypothetical protein
MAHKAELRAKVERRVAELKQALAAAEREHTAERIDGLRVVLRLADDATHDGWDAVSEVTAVTLSKWLETTQPLILPQVAASPT